MNLLDIKGILQLGITGFGFLLAFLTYRLLDRSLKDGLSKRHSVRIYFFMGFSLVLCILALIPTLTSPRSTAAKTAQNSAESVSIKMQSESANQPFDSQAQVSVSNESPIKTNVDKMKTSYPLERALRGRVLHTQSLVRVHKGISRSGHRNNTTCSPGVLQCDSGQSQIRAMSSIGSSQPQVHCVNVQGHWKLLGTDLTPMNIVQNSCEIHADFASADPGPKILHSVTGTFSGNSAPVAITRTDSTGCSSKLFANFTLQQDGRLLLLVREVEQKCHLTKDDHAIRLWERE